MRMSRIALLADIHGNLPALEAVLDHVESWRPHAIVVAGDAICWGPQSREVLERLELAQAVGVRGNNEYYLLDWQTPRMPAAWAAYGLLPPLFEELGERWRGRIALWPDDLVLRYPDAPPIHVTHGRPGDPWRGILRGDEVDLSAIPEGILVTAHTHLEMDAEIAGKRVINPGSVGVPLDGDRRARYATFEAIDGDWRVIQHRVPYDTALLDEAWREKEFEKLNGAMAPLVMQEFSEATLQVLPFLAFRSKEGQGLTEEEALARFTPEVRRRYTPEPYLNATLSPSYGGFPNPS